MFDYLIILFLSLSLSSILIQYMTTSNDWPHGIHLTEEVEKALN